MGFAELKSRFWTLSKLGGSVLIGDISSVAFSFCGGLPMFLIRPLVMNECAVFMLRKGKCRRDSGFTLIEVIASVAVLGIAFAALLTGLAWNVSTIKFARETVRATQIMEDKLDTIRLYSWDQITTPGFITNQFYASFCPSNALSPAALGMTYTGRITIATAPLSEAYRTNMLLITIDLDWPSSPEVRHAQMSTFVSKYGLQGYIY